MKIKNVVILLFFIVGYDESSAQVRIWQNSYVEDIQGNTNKDSIYAILKGIWICEGDIIKSLSVQDSVWQIIFNDTSFGYYPLIKNTVDNNGNRQVSIVLHNTAIDWDQFEGEAGEWDLPMFNISYLSKDTLDLRNVFDDSFLFRKQTSAKDK